MHPTMPLTSFPFFLTNTPTTPIYTLSLHDALPISDYTLSHAIQRIYGKTASVTEAVQHLTRIGLRIKARSEEHTSELQSHVNLVCRLLLEKKKLRRRVPPRPLSCGQCQKSQTVKMR